MKEFVDVFSWYYEVLKTFDMSIIQHNIPIKLDSKNFRKKLRQVNPMCYQLSKNNLRGFWMQKSLFL